MYKLDLICEASPATITALLEPAETIEKDMQHIVQNLLKHSRRNVAVMSRSWTPVSYLSLQDNLIFGASLRRKHLKKMIRAYLEAVQLNDGIFYDSITELSDLDRLKLQLIQCLLTNKEILVMDDFFANLTIQQIQEFLPLLQHLVKERSLTIYLFTSDEKIASSPYIDCAICDAV